MLNPQDYGLTQFLASYKANPLGLPTITKKYARHLPRAIIIICSQIFHKFGWPDYFLKFSITKPVVAIAATQAIIIVILILQSFFPPYWDSCYPLSLLFWPSPPTSLLPYLQPLPTLKLNTFSWTYNSYLLLYLLSFYAISLTLPIPLDYNLYYLLTTYSVVLFLNTLQS